MPKHRVALIGMFNSVKAARAQMPESCELVGLCDIKQDLLARCREEDSSVLITDDFREIAAMPGCDTVVAWTPNATHRDIAVACLEGGKHVFIEKPMGVNVEQGREIVEAERKAGRYVGVDLEYRWGDEARWVRELIQSGEIGDIRQVELDHHRGGWLWDTPSGEYRTKKAYSGLMRMEGIHYLDLLRFYLGDIAKVHAYCLPNTLPHYEFPDNMTLMLYFASGAVGRYTTSHNKAGYVYGNDPKCPALGHQLNLAIVGTKGLLRIDGWKHRIDVYHLTAKPEGTLSLKPEYVRTVSWELAENPFNASHNISGYRRDFMQRMADGRPPFQRAEDVHRSERLAFAIDEACRPEGATIDASTL